MVVKVLACTVYDESGWRWQTEETRQPEWNDIESAIRRLDRFRYPFISLFLERDDATDESPDFTVVGGEGVFGIECLVGAVSYRLVDPSHSNEEIVVWRSDQGAIFEEIYCCYSLPIVLQATRYFCEHGAPDLNLTWESSPSWR